MSKKRKDFLGPEYDKVIKKNWGFYNFIKRAFDIVSSFCVIVVILPILILIPLLIMICSPGNPFYVEKRKGKNNKDFYLLKYRTMYKDSENIDKYLNKEQKIQWEEERKIDNDPRITKIGKILRKTSLDELPQLFNILVGSMSVVGYRPMEENEINKHFTKNEQKILLLGKPGLTGYWQVYGRGKAEYKTGERQKIELEYYLKRSLSFDLKLIFLTIPAVIKGEGAK